MPLAHLLAPQIQARAEQIEAELGHTPVGYLQATAGAQGSRGEGGHNSREPLRRKVDVTRAPAGPTASDRALKELRGAPNKRPDQVTTDAVIKNSWEQRQKRGEYGVQPIPNAQAPAPIATKKNKRGQTVIPIDDLNAPMGFAEDGQAVNARGKKLGYLQDPNIRTLERRPTDVSLGAKDTHDAFATGVIQRKYADHLKAMQYDSASGNMKFPLGYLDGMSKRERQDVEAGVRALQQIEGGVRI